MAKSKAIAVQSRIVLPGSQRTSIKGAATRPTSPRAMVTVSVILRRKEPLKINRGRGVSAGPVRVSRSEYRKHHAADPKAAQLATPNAIMDRRLPQVE
jgi:hypothetical protein